ncbi:hypothetical protein, partial [uncultured Maricaulis sp.]|uniref:hypothetical protein n=1 Tax=uncultured Maricaulis sp. TaxID=174710 RepID=UPI0030D8800A
MTLVLLASLVSLAANNEVVADADIPSFLPAGTTASVLQVDSDGIPIAYVIEIPIDASTAFAASLRPVIETSTPADAIYGPDAQTGVHFGVREGELCEDGRVWRIGWAPSGQRGTA